MPKDILIGGMGPLSAPGFISAGKDLRAGMTLAVDRLNAGGGVLGRRLALAFEDSAGRPDEGVAAMARLVARGVCVLAGEFHSVVADAMVVPIDRTGIPFVCASATLDTITTRRLPGVFRLSPAQSHSWSVFADYLLGTRVGHVIALLDDSAYWAAGAAVIKARVRADARWTTLNRSKGVTAREIVGAIEALVSADDGSSVVLPLVSYPEPLGSVARELDRRGLEPPLARLADPAGRPCLADWPEVAGSGAVDTPYLAHVRPHELTAVGRQAAARFEDDCHREPSFVALEGYDAVLAVAAAMQAAGSTEPAAVARALRSVGTAGTRGEIRFSTTAEPPVHQQWRWPPVCVLAQRAAGRPLTAAEVLFDPRS